MKIIPIVFTFNHYVLMPAGVCICSLLKNANNDTFYDIHIMHGNDDLNDSHKQYLAKLNNRYSNFAITYINIGDVLDKVYTARGIPKLTYYRIYIPEFVHNYDKIIFSDVDIIFKGDLSSIYDTDLEGYCLAAVKSLVADTKYIHSIGCDISTYTNGGFQIYNLPELRKQNIKDKQLSLCGKKFVYLDQDITNIVCKGKIKFISPRYNSDQGFYYVVHRNINSVENHYYKEQIIEALENPHVIHYNGRKPWHDLVYRYDYWWEEYRESVFFEEEFYFKAYYKILNPNWEKLLYRLLRSLLKDSYFHKIGNKLLWFKRIRNLG
jgi:lipopolysaccharide biosynthesis glycosyltransferase